MKLANRLVNHAHLLPIIALLGLILLLPAGADRVIYASSGANSALDFDDSNDFVTLPATSLPTGQGTIEYWVKHDTSTLPAKVEVYMKDGISDVGYNGFGNDTSILEIHTAINNGTARFHYQDGGSSNGLVRVDGATTLNTGQWYHIAVTYNTLTEMKLYVNGVLDDTENASGKTFDGKTPVEAFIGRPGAAERFLDGQIDEVRVWNVVRTQAQIQADMHRRLAGTESTLQAY